MTFFYDLNKRLNALSEPKSTQLNEGKGDGNLANNAKPYDKVTRGDVIAGRLGKDEMGGKHKDAKSKFKKTNETDMEEGNRFTGNLMKARAAGKKQADLDGDGDMEPVREDVDGEFTAADWKKVVSLKRKLMQADPSREPEDAEQEAVEILGYDYDKVLAWLDSDENLEEADYSAKKARAGKDIGKPGKNFEKIAKSAGERYGSKERGEKVAGAVLAKLRGKNESVEEAVKEIPGGRRHTAEPGGYGRKDDDEAPKPTVKKGRGRPKKGSDSETGEVMKPDWSAFGVGKVNLPKHKGAVTKHKMVDEGEDGDVEAAIRMLKKAGYTVSKDKKELDEKAVSKAQRAAAGIAYAAKKGDLPKSELKGASKEMAKMPAGELKKFAKTKEKGLPEKKKKEVDETTVAGSVAPAADAPKSAKGMTFGKGIYDSWNRELESMIAESINVSVNMSTGGADGTPTKNLTVSADGDDAERLSELLLMAGLNHSTPAAEGSGCGTRQMDENAPDWPTNTEYSDDAFQYSGGLNKPKSTGQTTAPIIASQVQRQDTDEEIEENYDPYFDPESRESQKYKEPRDDVDPDSDYPDDLDEGWKEKLGAAGLAGAMAMGSLGAGAAQAAPQQGLGAPTAATQQQTQDVWQPAYKRAFSLYQATKNPTLKQDLDDMTQRYQQTSHSSSVKNHSNPDRKAQEQKQIDLKFKGQLEQLLQRYNANESAENDEIRLMKERAGIADGKYTQDYFTANKPSAERQRAEADREHRPNTPFSRDPIEATTDRAVDQLSKMFKMFKKK